MEDYVILTDSTTDLPPHLIRELDVQVLPLGFTMEGRNYTNDPDHHQMSVSTFYQNLREGVQATTTMLTVPVFLKAFAEVLEAGRDLLYISFSSALSGSYNSAELAARELRERYPQRKLLVVDSLCASLGEGLLVRYAALRRQAGATCQQLHDWLLANRLQLCHWFTVDDLQHLRRGGRVSAAAARVGTMLRIKPVMHVDNEGRLIPVSKERGRKQSLKELVKHMQQTAIRPEEQTIFIGHGDDLEDAQALAGMVRATLPVRDIFIGNIGPVIGAHSGPGTIALFFMGEKR